MEHVTLYTFDIIKIKYQQQFLICLIYSMKMNGFDIYGIDQK